MGVVWIYRILFYCMNVVHQLLYDMTDFNCALLTDGVELGLDCKFVILIQQIAPVFSIPCVLFQYGFLIK